MLQKFQQGQPMIISSPRYFLPIQNQQGFPIFFLSLQVFVSRPQFKLHSQYLQSPINCVFPSHRYFLWLIRLEDLHLSLQFIEGFFQCFIEFVAWIIVWSKFRIFNTWFCSFINELMSFSYLSWCYNPKFWIQKFITIKAFSICYAFMVFLSFFVQISFASYVNLLM